MLDELQKSAFLNTLASWGYKETWMNYTQKATATLSKREATSARLHSKQYETEVTHGRQEGEPATQMVMSRLPQQSWGSQWQAE